MTAYIALLAELDQAATGPFRKLVQTLARCWHSWSAASVSYHLRSALELNEEQCIKARHWSNPAGGSGQPVHYLLTNIELVPLNLPIFAMALHQHTHAQPMHNAVGHATRAGHTSQQPQMEQPDIAKFGGGFPMPPTFENPLEEREYLKGRLAAAFRIFGAKGFGKGVSGHISCRDPVEPNTFWLNAFGQSYATIRRSDLVRVDHEGNLIEAGRYKLINRAAIMIHVAGMSMTLPGLRSSELMFRTVHEVRPDVICVAHAHSLYGRAFSALGKDLPILSQDGCAFHNVSRSIYTTTRSFYNHPDSS